MAGTSTPKYYIWINVGFWIKWIRYDIHYQVCSTNMLYQKPGFRFWSTKVEDLTQENHFVFGYAWAKPTLSWNGWFQQWLADGNTRENELHCLYGQPESTVPSRLFCTCLGQQQERLLRGLFCDVPSVVCPVLWQMGSSGWRVGMDGLVCQGTPWGASAAAWPAPKQWGTLQEVSCAGSWPVSFGMLWHCLIILYQIIIGFD